MPSWNTRLRSLRLDAKQSKSELARHVGVSPAAVTEWENGVIKTLKGENLARLCKLYHVNADWLLYGRGAKHPAPNPVRDVPAAAGLVPVLSWRHALDVLNNKSKNMDALTHLPCPDPHSERTIALRVTGDAMTAAHGRTYPDGCMIYIDPEKAAQAVSVDRVLALVDGHDVPIFAVYVQHAGRELLHFLNPAYPTIAEPFRILGKVIGSYVSG
jgi:SOS-response transcriptional repressor LexA